jgi:CheY-like chemotaxis protein
MPDQWAQAALVGLWLYAAAECCVGVIRHGWRVLRYRRFLRYIRRRYVLDDIAQAEMWLHDELARLRIKALLFGIALLQCWMAVERGLLPVRRVDLDLPQSLTLIVFLLLVERLMAWTRQADAYRAPEIARTMSTATGLVYVVDDSPVMRLWMTKTLEAVGHAVVAFGDGGGLLGALAAQVPDVVLLDLVVGAESGIAIAQQVRAQYPTLPLYLVTGHAADMTVDEMAGLVRQADAQGWVAKPIRQGALERVVAEALVGREGP